MTAQLPPFFLATTSSPARKCAPAVPFLHIESETFSWDVAP
jgi:hypothetical protein